MASTTVTPAERIRELSAINSDVAAMLNAAGQAIHALTNRPLNAADDDTHMADEDASNTLQAHKQSFQENAEAYFHNLQGVFARLRRQAYALEDAGIITADSSVLGGVIPRAAAAAPAVGPGPGAPPQQQTQDVDKIKNGGLGNFDVGWLNSRGNKVGEEKEAELVQEAKELLEDVLAKGKG